jgi:hypothetical protein
MTELRNLKSVDLISKTKALVVEERRVTLEVLKYIREIDRRRTYAELGFSSLWKFLVKELCYSSAAAYRRIESMRLLCDVPTAEAKIEDGSLSLSTAAALSQFFKVEKKEFKKSYSVGEKQTLIEQVSHKSKRDVEKILAEKSPSYLTKVTKDRMRVVAVPTQRLDQVHR